MSRGGTFVGVIIILLVVFLVVLGSQHNERLEQERAQAVAQLISMPEYQNCKYDASTCPQAQEMVIPNTSAAGLIILGILLGIYLIRNDMTQRKMLDELAERRSQLSKEERQSLIMSVLTVDEQKIVEAVRQQPGISQATLRLRTDMSKAKLSVLLKELERREIIKKVEDGKTNAIHLKRDA